MDSGSLTVSVAADTAGNISSYNSKEEAVDTTGNSSSGNNKAKVDVILDDDDGGKRRKLDNVGEWIRLQNMVLRLSDKVVFLHKW